MNKKLTQCMSSSWKYVILIALMLATLVPFLMIISVSFSDQDMIDRLGYQLIPAKISLEGYQYVLSSPKQVINAYAVTIFITVVGTILNAMICSLIAYPLSRKDFLYRRFVSLVVYIPMLIGGGVVPTYILITQYLRLQDTIWVLFIPSLVSVWNIFMLRTFFSNVPEALIESSKIEGAGELRIFAQIVLPLSKTGLATIALFSSLGYWNEWFSSLLYINNDKYITLQFLLYRIMENMQFLQREGANAMAVQAVKMPVDAAKMAIVVVAAGPMLCVFPFFQKYFVKGITVGSVKG